jgi:hypothetical protein
MKSGTENRRKQKRYPVSSGIFVVLNPAGHSSKLGTMIDISKSGLSLQYLDVNDSAPAYSELDVFASGHGMLIWRLPFTIVSRTAFQEPNPFYSLISRRMGVKFNALSDVKHAKLSSFIQAYGIHETFPDNPA